ncbi:MAG: flagellar biosynthetic protein FliO [Syntrophales bacterium]|jgi:flagellar protein FliO/FliZ|nr:flagellar biosynthetic protein FliO [Syntrophales bacterium]
MESVSIMSSFLNMIFALAVILGLLLGAVYLLKKFLPNAAPAFVDNSIINIVSARYLGPKSSVMILEILGKVIVIGVSADKLSYLTEISGEEALEKLKKFKEQNRSLPSFTDYMKKNRFFNRLEVFFKERRGMRK